MEVRILKGLHAIWEHDGTRNAGIGKRSGMIGLVPYYQITYYHMIMTVSRKS